MHFTGTMITRKHWFKLVFFSLVQLWDEYGLVGQLVVSISSYVLIIIECFT